MKPSDVSVAAARILMRLSGLDGHGGARPTSADDLAASFRTSVQTIAAALGQLRREGKVAVVGRGGAVLYGLVRPAKRRRRRR